MTPGEIMEKREHWASRTAFIFAAIGSAIGLGNIWRFPRICAQNGGAAFLVAYVVALFTTGIPILILELAIGQRSQKATPGSFSYANKKLEWLGWCVVGVGFMITTYYAVIMGWATNYFVYSFTQAWGSAPKDFFFNGFLHVSNTESLPGGWGHMSISILGATILSWVAIMACIWRGVKTVSKVVYITVLAPWFLLVIFVVRGMTLPGAFDGLKYYLFVQDQWSFLLKSKTWLNAFTQVFFSLSIGFGIMFAYGSFINPKTSIVKNAFIIGISDSLTAFVGGLAVFCSLGYLATPDGGGIPIQSWMDSSLGICFVAYPTLINKLPAGYIFGPLFFLMLLTLAVDSAFSLVEASIAPIEDKFKWPHKKAMFVVCFLAFLIGIPITFQSGLYWFDTLDNFMNQFGLAGACLIECIIFGYLYKASRIRRELKENPENKLGPWWGWMIRYVSPLVLIFLIGTELVDRIKGPYGEYPRITEFLGGWLALIFIACMALFLTLAKGREKA